MSPLAIHHNGIVVGTIDCFASGTSKAFLWNGTEPMDLVPLPPGTTYSYLADISDDGLAVGTLNIQNNGQPNFAFVSDGVTTTLIQTPEPANAFGIGISSNGIVAGRWDSPAGFPRGFTWQGGAFTDHGTLGALTASIHDVNALGDMTGYRYFGNGAQNIPFVKLHAQDLMDLELPPPFWTARGDFINNDGAVAGTMRVDASPVKNAFVWKDGEFLALPPLPGAESSIARGLGADILVVGYSQPAAGSAIATVWIEGTPYDLSDAAGVPGLAVAEGADAAGNIVARYPSSNVMVILRPVFGDANCDEGVDWRDLLLVLANWGPCDADCPGDIDYDGHVGVADLDSVMMNWDQAK